MESISRYNLNGVKNAEEAFLSASTKRIVPIVKIDDCTLGDGKPGEITIDLIKRLNSILISH